MFFNSLKNNKRADFAGFIMRLIQKAISKIIWICFSADLVYNKSGVFIVWVVKQNE